MTAKVMFSFPDQLVARMKASIPRQERSKIVAAFLENEIRSRENRLYLCAKEFEENQSLKKEMDIWDNEFSQDGLDNV